MALSKDDIIKANLRGKEESIAVRLLEKIEELEANAAGGNPAFFKRNQNVNSSAVGATYVMDGEDVVGVQEGLYKVTMKVCISNFDGALNFRPIMTFNWEDNGGSPVSRGGLELQANTPSIDTEFTFEFMLNITENRSTYELTYFVAPSNLSATYIFRYASIQLDRVGDSEAVI